MAFTVAAEAYDRFMGRFSAELAAPFADLAGVVPGSSGRVLDVGAGPGALSLELVLRLGAEQVSALEPSASFVAAFRDRVPGVEVLQASAESLPYGDSEFVATLAQLVVHFMADPEQGVAEMARVTVPGGVVVASVWDHAGGRGPLSVFWQAASDVDPEVIDESQLTGASRGDLHRLLVGAGLLDVSEGELTVSRRYESFDEWWEPYTLGVGPAGDLVAGLDEVERWRVRQRCLELLPTAPFDVEAVAWAARGRVP